MLTFQDALKKSFVEGFTRTDMATSEVLVTLAVTLLIGVYLFFIYKLVNRSSCYNRTYHVAMSMISVITAGIIIAMQSSIVISLGMVGALSIIRFRTAIKDTMDLLFLFWSIGEGIICGAGLFKIAIMVAFIVTVGIFILEYLPMNKKPYILVVNSTYSDRERIDAILDAIEKLSKSYSVKSRNLKVNGFDIIVEVSTDQEQELISRLGAMEGVHHVSLLSNEGEVRF